MKLQFGSLENVENPFITIIPRSTLVWSGNTCLGLNYGSNRTGQSFIQDYYCY